MSLINQREVGRHTLTFAAALEAALREDPDIVLVGEMRDLERLGDLLNGDDRFLPVRTIEGVVLVKLARIVTARTALAEEDDGLMRLGQRYPVQITTMLGEISAILFANMPESHRRVKDCLNLSERFLPLSLTNQVLHLNTDYILYVRD